MDKGADDAQPDKICGRHTANPDTALVSAVAVLRLLVAATSQNLCVAWS